MPEQNEIEIRSDEVQEILSHTPNWMIRWGISSIFFLILLVIGVGYFVKYPDVIKGEIILTTEIPPVKLVSKTNGKLQTLLVKQGEFVEQGDNIAIIESTLSDSVIEFLRVIPNLFRNLNNTKNEIINNHFSKAKNLTFGEIQTEYYNLKKQYKEYYVLKNDNFYQKQLNSIKKQITYYSRLSTISYRQMKLTEKDLANAEVKFKTEENLYKKGVLSKMEFFDKQAALNQNKQQVENLKKGYVQNQITVSGLKKQLYELEYNSKEKERVLSESIKASVNSIENYIQAWKQNYNLTAPFKGKVSYLSTLNENQFIKAGEQLFAIIPKNNEYIGAVTIPAQGFGKIKVGQLVHLKLDNYPYNEYGQLNGEVKEISLVPSQNQEGKAFYLVKINLTNGLTTTYNKELEYKPEMHGIAEIITEDLRITDRVFNSFRKLMDK